MPSTLHWFKWEAYTTWITGMLLLAVLYYLGSDAYLLDPSKSAITKLHAIALSLGSVALGYAVYEALCRSPLIQSPKFFLVVVTALLALWTWGLDQFLTDRAAYIHVGALIGTCMAANVFMVIMPGQRYMVGEVEAGRIPDSAPGLKAKERSVHNNYATLPVIFIMLSNHFAFTYSHPFGWAVLVAIFIIGLWMRHFFNLKHRGIYKPSVLIGSLLAFFALMATLAPWGSLRKDPNAIIISDSEVMEIVDKHCTECHAANPRSAMFSAPPSGFIIENLDQVLAAKSLVNTRAVVNKDMPLGNLTQMTEEERKKLADWLAAR